MPTELVVFSDGACSGNPGPGGCAYLIVSLNTETVSWKSGHSRATTNNAMELQALLAAANDPIVKNCPEILFLSDSKYVLQGAQSWVLGWKAKGWLKADGTPPENLSLWKAWDIWLLERDDLNLPKPKYQYVPGHAGVPGNEFVDRLAVQAAAENCQHKKWPTMLSETGIKVGEITPRIGLNKNPNEKKAKPYYLVWDGVSLKEFFEWKDCEREVRGKRNLKYKKIRGQNERSATLKSWGIHDRE